MRRATTAAIAVALLAVACGDGAAGSTEGFCRVLGANVEENTTIFQPGDPTDPDELVDALQRLTDAAPEDIDGDMAVITESVEDYRQALDRFDPDDPATAEALEPPEPDEEERIREAQGSVVTFAREECGIELDQPVVTVPPTTGPPTTTTAAPTTAPPTTAAPSTTVG